MKIGILTITDGSNYGNRLQNYAMQELIRLIGCEAETIQRLTIRDASRHTQLIILIKDTFKRIIGNRNTNFKARKRKKYFDNFNKQYIKFSDYRIFNNIAPDDLKEAYDFFICGSDQIWNANFEIVSCDIQNHLASFANSKQRIAFAASFGTTSIASGYEGLFREELIKFSKIAVREDAGKKIIEDITGRKDIKVVLDPTLLLEKNKWIELERKPKYLRDEKYVVTYFLGGRNEKINRYIEDTYGKSEFKVINLDNEFLMDYQISNGDVFCTSPDEFIWLIHYASFVLTDSFHASAFSVIFEKPFVVFERIAAEKNNDMGSRIDTLLNKFSLNDCRDDIDNPSKIPNKNDYSECYELLEIERRKAIDFLKDALGE